MVNQFVLKITAVARHVFLSRRGMPLLLIASVAVSFLVARWTTGPRLASAQSPRATQLPKTPATSAAPATKNPVAPASGNAPAAPAAANRQPVSKPVARPAPAATNAPMAQTASANPAPAQAPAVLAVVNNEQITREQLGQDCLHRFGKEVLESIVNKHLIWQECQARGINITEQDINDEVARAATKFGLTPDRFLAMLKEERDISPDQYRREITWPSIALRRLASGQIEVTPEEMKQAFDAEYGPQVKVRMIALATKAEADQVYREVMAQPDRFADIAKEKSKDTHSASVRGQIPPVRRNSGEPEIERVVFALKEGEISPVVFAANQFLIFKCEKHIPESYVAGAQIKQIEARLRDQIHDTKLRSSAQGIFQKLQSQAKVVQIYNDPSLGQRMPGVVATINQSQITSKQLAEECLARHGKDVLEGEINRKLLEQELRRRNKNVARGDIDREVTRAAEAYGFLKPDRTPDVDAWLKAVTDSEQVSVDLYLRDSVWPSVALKTIVGDVVQVTQEDMTKGFDSNYGERVEVLAIVLGNQRDANRIWELARANPTDQFFGELAQQYSMEAVSRNNMGKVPPIRRYGGQPLLEEEAFRMKVGEMSGIVAVGDKFVILRCLGRTSQVVTDRTAVAEELRNDIHEKKLRIAMANEFDRLRSVAQIDNYLSGSTQSGKRTDPRTQPVSRTPSQPQAPPPGAGAASSVPRGVAPATFAPPAGVKR